MFCFAAGITITMMPEEKPAYEVQELLAMNDFTALEQENYTVGMTTVLDELTFDSYI